jgi:hypothetical protein
VDYVFVVAAFLWGQRLVVLHSDIKDIGRISCKATEEARCGGHSDERR